MGTLNPKVKERITLGMGAAQAITALSEGNPGAMNACLELLQQAPAIDPQGALGGFGPLMLLDSLGLYGPNLYVLHNDACQRNVARVLTVLRAVQLGLYPAAELVRLADQQVRSAWSELPITDLYYQVRQRLPAFDAQGTADFPDLEKVL